MGHTIQRTAIVALQRHEPHDDTPGNFGRRINTAFVCMGTVSWSGHFVRMRWCIITIQLRVQYSHCAASFAVSVRPGFPQSSVAANHQSLGWQAVGLYSKLHHSPRQSNCDKPGLSASVISELGLACTSSLTTSLVHDPLRSHFG